MKGVNYGHCYIIEPTMDKDFLATPQTGTTSLKRTLSNSYIEANN